MNKRLLVAILLSVVTVYGLQYFFNRKSTDGGQQGVVNLNQSVAPGQPIKVPTTQDLYRPLNVDVSFADGKFAEAESLTQVRTKYYNASFSNYGAVMKSIEFAEHVSKNGNPLQTIQSKSFIDEEARKKGCFFLAFDGKTPFIYKLVKQTEKPNPKNAESKLTELVYESETDNWRIAKTYVLHDDSYQIDLTVAVEPKGAVVAVKEDVDDNEQTSIKPSKKERVRVFFVAPLIGELADDPINPLMFNEIKNQIDKGQMDNIVGNVWYWTTPSIIFGAEDRYFVHTLINDADKFTQRAYFKKADARTLMPVLEGPVLKGKQAWTLSFYMGPKVVDQLAFVDERLTDLMSFGWLTWLCKILLQMLDYLFSFLHNYGLAIILLTFLLRLPFTPLSIYARRKMEEYQQYQPAINKIRLKYKDNAQLQHAEVMKFHKDHNISPTTQMVGCLPLIIQMPILFGLYRVLNSSLDLYQAPFYGWLTDLSSKDPYYITPVLMGLTMIWQQKMQPVNDEKQRVMMLFMSVVMTVVFINFPAGLVLYWFVNNLLTIGEDYLRKFLFK